MTDNEIIKALECCGRESCLGCPYRDGKCHQGNPMIRDALDLITRQQSEIERLNIVYQANQQLINALNKSYFLAKAEAYKEFAEKLKKKCYEDFEETDEMLAPYVTEDNIDNLLKEMEDNNND